MSLEYKTFVEIFCQLKIQLERCGCLKRLRRMLPERLVVAAAPLNAVAPCGGVEDGVVVVTRLSVSNSSLSSNLFEVESKISKLSDKE